MPPLAFALTFKAVIVIPADQSLPKFTEGATLQHLSTCLGRGIKHFSDKLHHASKAEFQDHPSAGRFVNFFLSDPIISLASNEDALDPGAVIFSLYPSSS